MIKLEVFTRQNDTKIECIVAVITENLLDAPDKVSLFSSNNVFDGFDSFKLTDTISHDDYKTKFISYIKIGFQYRFEFNLTEQTILSNMYNSIMSIVTNS